MGGRFGEAFDGAGTLGLAGRSAGLLAHGLQRLDPFFGWLLQISHFDRALGRSGIFPMTSTTQPPETGRVGSPPDPPPRTARCFRSSVLARDDAPRSSFFEVNLPLQNLQTCKSGNSTSASHCTQ
ncbi:hypothetical protein [Glycomyces sp. NPDC021274]|uniref:hypothetical protein n=1 Tax=Glycomyces sp. NPDC021274 TaxID=3155120 RepID=UPI0033FF82E5